MDDTDQQADCASCATTRGPLLPRSPSACAWPAERCRTACRGWRLTAPIVGYTVRLRPDVEEQRIRALMTVAVEGNRTEAVIRTLRGDPAVSALHTTNGRWDIVAELRADSLEAFDRVLAASGWWRESRTPRRACCSRRTSSSGTR